METTSTLPFTSIKEERILAFQKLLEDSKNITIKDINDPIFRDWKYRFEKTILKFFGDESPDVIQLRKLDFYDRAFKYFPYSPKIMQHENIFMRDFSTAQKLLEHIIDELKFSNDSSSIQAEVKSLPSKTQ